jgi:hypothetical protein
MPWKMQLRNVCAFKNELNLRQFVLDSLVYYFQLN